MPRKIFSTKTDLVQCRRRIFLSTPASVGYALLVFFSSAHLSVPGGLAFDFLFLPAEYFKGDIYLLLFDLVPQHALGLTFLIATALAYAAVLRIGPNICGLCLPVPECMPRITARIYILSYFLLWVGLLAFGIFFATTGPVTGASTYMAIAISQVIRVSIVLPKALSPPLP